MIMTADGRFWPEPDTTGMMSPVRCTYCGGIYDLAAVTVTARYADCSMWTTPCCSRSADDRLSWGGADRRCYTELKR